MALGLVKNPWPGKSFWTWIIKPRKKRETKRVLRSKMTKRSTHAKTRQNACRPSTARTKVTGRTFIWRGSYSRSRSDHRGNRAQDSKQFLIVRDVGLVYVREHRSNVRTIEQILFKYSRGRPLHLSPIYTLRNRFYIQYGLNGIQEKHGIPSSTLLRFSGGWRFNQFFNFQKSVMTSAISMLSLSLCLSLFFSPP